MAYIRIKLEGHRTFGGYLTVDEGKLGNVRDMRLIDCQLIKVSAGFHQIRIMSMTSGELNRNKMLRENINSARFSDAWREYENMLNCIIDYEFGHFDVMTLNIKSGINGNILEMPTYSVTTLKREAYEEIEKIARQEEELMQKRIAEAHAEAERKARPKKMIKKILLWILVGFIGINALAYLFEKNVTASIVWGIIAGIIFLWKRETLLK